MTRRPKIRLSPRACLRRLTAPLGLLAACCVLAAGCGTQSPAASEAAWLRAHAQVLADAPVVTRAVVAALDTPTAATRRPGCVALASYAAALGRLPAMPLASGQRALATMRSDMQAAIGQCERAASTHNGAAAAAMAAAMFDAGQQLRLLGDLNAQQGE